jgi:hypothetical protein
MAEPKKKAAPQTPKTTSSDPFDSSLNDLLSREELDKLSTLQIVDLIASKLPNRHSTLLDMVYLRERIAGVEEMNFQAQQALEKMDAIIEKLRSRIRRTFAWAGRITFAAWIRKFRSPACKLGSGSFAMKRSRWCRDWGLIAAVRLCALTNCFPMAACGSVRNPDSRRWS